MKLLTKEVIAKLQPMGSTENILVEDKWLKVKFFCPWSNFTWYPVEFDGKDEFFGLVEGFEFEWVYFTLSELEMQEGPFGLKIERDLYFTPQKASEITSYGRGYPIEN